MKQIILLAIIGLSACNAYGQDSTLHNWVTFGGIISGAETRCEKNHCVIIEKWNKVGNDNIYSVWNTKPIPCKGYYCDTSYEKEGVDGWYIKFAIFYDGKLIVDMRHVTDFKGFSEFYIDTAFFKQH